MVSINPIDRWPSSRITVQMLTGAPQSTCFGSRGSPVQIRAPRLGEGRSLVEEEVPPPRRRSNHRLGSLECPSSRDRRSRQV